MKKGLLFLILPLLILAIIFVAFKLGLLVQIFPQSWKIFSGSIGTAEFAVLDEKYNGFIDMNIDEVLHLISRRERVFIIEPGKKYNYFSYNELIEVYPDWALVGERKKLYCVAIYNSYSPEETFPVGFFVNEDGIVIEPHIPVDIIW